MVYPQDNLVIDTWTPEGTFLGSSLEDWAKVPDAEYAVFAVRHHERGFVGEIKDILDVIRPHIQHLLILVLSLRTRTNEVASSMLGEFDDKKSVTVSCLFSFTEQQQITLTNFLYQPLMICQMGFVDRNKFVEKLRISGNLDVKMLENTGVRIAVKNEEMLENRTIEVFVSGRNKTEDDWLCLCRNDKQPIAQVWWVSIKKMFQVMKAEWLWSMPLNLPNDLYGKYRYFYCSKDKILAVSNVFRIGPEFNVLSSTVLDPKTLNLKLSSNIPHETWIGIFEKHCATNNWYDQITCATNNDGTYKLVLPDYVASRPSKYNLNIFAPGSREIVRGYSLDEFLRADT